MPTDDYVPPRDDRDWEVVDPADLGWDLEALEDLADFCERQATDQLVVALDGRIVFERCWRGAQPSSMRDVGSVQKSLTSVLVGVLVERGVLALDEPVARWLGSGWTRASEEQEAAITLRHLLSMCSGLYDDFGFEAAPETVWYYNNNGYHQVRKIMERATGSSTQELSAELVFAPLGMTASAWVLRPNMVDPSGWVLSGLQTSARDLVRLGLMVQRGGRFGESVVLEPGGYLEAALETSQSLNPSYGLLWWLPNRPWAIIPGPDPGSEPDPRKSFGGHRVGHPLAPSAPEDAKASFGVGGQRLSFSASLGVVLARRGGPVDARTPLDEELWRRIRAAAREGPDAPLPAA